MADVATLGLKIDSSQAATASKELDKLSAAGKKAENTFAGIERAAAKGGTANKGYAAALGQAYGVTGQMTEAQVKAIRGYETLIGQTTLLNEGRKREAAQFVALRKAGTTADTEYGRTVAALAGNLYDLEQQQDKTNNSAGNFANTLTRRFVVGLLVSQIRQLTSAVVGLNSELAQTGYLGRLTGLGSGGFQGLQQVASSGGINGNALASAMVAFNQQIPLAKAGIGDLGQLLRANRVTVTDTSDAFFKVADLVRNAKDETARLSILQQAGLPATREFANLMSQGSTSLKQQIDDMPKLGDAQIAQAERLEKRFNTLWTNFTTWGKQAIVDVASSASAIDDAITRFYLKINPKLAGAISPLSGGKQMSQSEADSFYSATGAGRSGTAATSAPTRDYATEKTIAQDRISKAQQYLGLLGQTTTAAEARRAVELQLQAAAINGVGIDKSRAETLKQLAYEQNLGITVMKASADAARVEAETIGMSVGQSTAYTAAQNAFNDAKRNGKALTDADTAAILQNAEALGRAAQNADTLRFTYENLVRGPMQTFRSEIAQGKTAMEALRSAGLSALDALSQKLMDMAAQNLWQSAFGGSKSGGGLMSIIGSLFGGGGAAGDPMASAKGNVFSGSGIGAYSNQIITKPTLFAFAKGAGLMGEAGEEAVMPLIRTSDGNLGVRAQGGSGSAPVNVTINQENHFTNADPNSEARMRAWAKQTKDAAVSEAVLQVAKVSGNKPTFLQGGR